MHATVLSLVFRPLSRLTVTLAFVLLYTALLGKSFNELVNIQAILDLTGAPFADEYSQLEEGGLESVVNGHFAGLITTDNGFLNACQGSSQPIELGFDDNNEISITFCVEMVFSRSLDLSEAFDGLFTSLPEAIEVYGEGSLGFGTYL